MPWCILILAGRAQKLAGRCFRRVCTKEKNPPVKLRFRVRGRKMKFVHPCTAGCQRGGFFFLSLSAGGVKSKTLTGEKSRFGIEFKIGCIQCFFFFCLDRGVTRSLLCVESRKA